MTGRNTGAASNSRYSVFALSDEKLRQACVPASDRSWRIEWWRPNFWHLRPPTLSWRFAAWSLFHFSRVFASRDFCVALIKDRGTVIQRTCFVPKYFRWRFADDSDLIVTSTWTHPAFRGQGLASWALRTACHALGRPRRSFWYLAREENLGSISVCEKAGFTRVGVASRTSCFGIRSLGQFCITQLSSGTYDHLVCHDR
jgi:RimJ/RimL family protein N-acetyltransferase